MNYEVTIIRFIIETYMTYTSVGVSYLYTGLYKQQAELSVDKVIDKICSKSGLFPNLYGLYSL